MPRTPAEQAFYKAERPIYDGATSLEKALAQLEALRRSFPGVLPVAAAEAHRAENRAPMRSITAPIIPTLARSRACRARSRAP